MSAYTTTATVAGIPVIRANPAGGPDTRAPDLVEVARNGLETNARDAVRVTVTQGNDVEASAYLTREAAEELAVTILNTADLNPEAPQPEARLAGGIGIIGNPTGVRAEERALRLLERALADAHASGALRPEILIRIANGFTGQTNGPRERTLARQFGDALEEAGA